MTRPRNLVGVQPVASGQLDNAAGRITFWSFAETTGAATAALKLWDGTGVSGTLLLHLTLAANESTRDYFPHPFVAYKSGLYLQVLSGSIDAQVQSLVFPHGDDWCLPVEVVNIGQLDIAVGG